MARITILITKDNGETTKVKKTVSESGGFESFDAIEQFTLQIRREMFPNLQKELLKDAQSAHKKKGLKSNGTRPVEIIGIESPVKFRLDRHKLGGDYFSSTKQFEHGLESGEVRSWIELEIQEKSYSKVSQCLEKITGTNVYSGNQISEKVKSYAYESTKALINSYAGLQLNLPFGATDIDIYDSKSEEILLFDDAIGVNRQKELRENGYDKKLKRVQTDVIEVQRPNKDLNKDLGLKVSSEAPPKKYFDYITAGYGIDGWTIETALCCWFCSTYGNTRLPIVAISDGAKDIRLRLWRVFGKQIVIILDWYHLNKKVWNLMSMIARNKVQKEKIAKEIVGLLWEGLTDDAILYLQKQGVRNQLKQAELIEYLQKHKGEIINYKKRKEANNTIGSGRAEKGVDMVVAYRQKNKPIAWSENGSYALSTLRAVSLNRKFAA